MEPTISPVRVIDESPSIAAIPKSVSSTRPSLARSTLPGFTSRCSTPTACAARSAPSTCSPIRAASRGSIRPAALAASAREGPSMYSMTIHGRSSCSRTSWTVTTAGCWIRAAARASFCVRACMTSRSAWATYRPAVSSLTATVLWSSSSCARHTLPMPPRPIGSTSRYRPASTSPPPVCCSTKSRRSLHFRPDYGARRGCRNRPGAERRHCDAIAVLISRQYPLNRPPCNSPWPFRRLR